MQSSCLACLKGLLGYSHRFTLSDVFLWSYKPHLCRHCKIIEYVTLYHDDLLFFMCHSRWKGSSSNYCWLNPVLAQSQICHVNGCLWFLDWQYGHRYQQGARNQAPCWGKSQPCYIFKKNLGGGTVPVEMGGFSGGNLIWLSHLVTWNYVLS